MLFPYPVEDIQGNPREERTAQLRSTDAYFQVLVIGDEPEAVRTVDRVEGEDIFQGVADGFRGVGRDVEIRHPFGDAFAHQGYLFFLLVQERLGQLQRFGQRILDTGVEPVIHAGRDELQRHEKQQNGRNEGQGQEGSDEFGFELVAEPVDSPFEEKFREIAQDQKEHEQDQQDIQVDQGEDQNIVVQRQGDLALEEDALDPDEKRNEQDADQDYPTDQFAFLQELSRCVGPLLARPLSLGFFFFHDAGQNLNSIDCQSVSTSHQERKGRALCRLRGSVFW